MSFIAGLTGCCIGLLTKLYSNSLRKLPYMRGRSVIMLPSSYVLCRALGTSDLYGRGRLLFLLRQEVYRTLNCDGSEDCRIEKRTLCVQCWLTWIERMFTDRKRRKLNKALFPLFWLHTYHSTRHFATIGSGACLSASLQRNHCSSHHEITTSKIILTTITLAWWTNISGLRSGMLELMLNNRLLYDLSSQLKEFGDAATRLYSCQQRIESANIYTENFISAISASKAILSFSPPKVESVITIVFSFIVGDRRGTEEWFAQLTTSYRLGS